jgi:hypothetical protein
MNYKDYFKQRIFEATFGLPGIFPYQASPDGQGLVPLQPLPPNNTNPIEPVPANPDRLPELPPGTPPQPPAPRGPNGDRLPGNFVLVPIRMPDGSVGYRWAWMIPGVGMLIWHPDGYWVKPTTNPLRPGTNNPIRPGDGSGTIA